MPTRILIVDDHELVREGLNSLIANDPELVVCGLVSTGETAIRQLQMDPPDLLLVDMQMEGVDGTRVIGAAHALAPATRVLVLSAHASGSYVRSALQAGAHGYVVKSEDGEGILRAIRSVVAGQSYLSPEVTGEVMKGYVEGPSQDLEGPFALLTRRERELLDLMLAGEVSNKDLAQRVYISERTVERHKTNIFRKLDVSGTKELLSKMEGRLQGS